MKGLPLYLDHHATTPVDPLVLEAMLPYFSENFGNAASKTHAYGWVAESAVEEARQRVADLIGATAREIIFTSGATESDNLAVVGAARAYQNKGRHLITTAIEHKAVLDACRALEKEGFEVTRIKPDSTGIIAPEAVNAAIRPDTTLISVIWANNEIGTIQDLAAIGKIAKERDVVFHTDAVQGLGCLEFNVDAMNVDLVSLTAHKMYGPKGCGALYVRRKNPRVELEPLSFGGGQERGVRSGTLNVPGIVGLGKACELAVERRGFDGSRMRDLRDAMIGILESEIRGFHLNGHRTQRLPNNIHFSIPGIQGEAFLSEMRDIAISASSACASEGIAGSHVLEALGLDSALTSCVVRVGLGRTTTKSDIEYAATRITAVARNLIK